MPLIHTGTIGSLDDSVARREEVHRHRDRVIDLELLAEGQIEGCPDAPRVEMPCERLIDGDVGEARLARPVVGSRAVGRDGDAHGKRGQSVVEPVMEVVGVEHDQHVRVDVVDVPAHAREPTRHERLGVRRAVAR